MGGPFEADAAVGFWGVLVRLYADDYWGCCLPPVMRTMVFSVDIVAVMLVAMFGKIYGINGDMQRLVEVQCVAINKQGTTKLLYTQPSCIATARTRPVCPHAYM